MAWITTVPQDEAEGLLGKIYQEARQRAGRVYNILKVQSLNPDSLRAGVALYTATMRAKMRISRTLREMIGTVVSRLNECHY